MNPPNNRPSMHAAMLWWIAIIALAVSGAIFYFLGANAEVDVTVRQQRMIFPLVGVVIAGVCLIIGTAGRWFK